jgi:hypothetical protein
VINAKDCNAILMTLLDAVDDQVRRSRHGHLARSRKCSSVTYFGECCQQIDHLAQTLTDPARRTRISRRQELCDIFEMLRARGV